MQQDKQLSQTADEAASPRRPVTPDTQVLYELLSERLLEDFPGDVWREVFVGPAYDSIRFDCRVVTFLAVQGLSGEWTKADLAAIARKHGAQVDCFKKPCTFAFPDARYALDMAVMLQSQAGHSLRMALVTAPCTLACYECDGCQGTLSLGTPASKAAAKASTTPAGSMYVAGETYHLIARAIEDRAAGAAVAKAMQGDVISSAVIMFRPALEPA
jgi:hypothetical protein